MKHNLLKSVILSVILLMGVSNAWAVSEGSNWYDANNAKVYFDNTNSSYSNVSLLIGRQWNYDSDGVGSSGVNFSLVSGTNNLYYASVTFYKYTTMCFINATNWGWEGSKVTARCTYATDGKYTNTSNDNLSNTTHLYVPASGNANANLTHTTPTSYTALNYTQTLEQHLSTNNGSTFTASTVAIATVKVSSNKLKSNNATEASSGTIASGSSSATCSAARTATVTYTVSGVKAGYTFVGWYDGNTQKSTSTTYTYQATGAKTITARFGKTYAVTISAGANGTVSPTGSQQVGSTSVTIKATANPGYKFKNWTITGDVVIANANNATTTITATATGTVKANFEEDLSSNWKLIGDNQTNSPFGDDYTYSNGKAMTKKSGHSTESNVYITLDIKHLPTSYYGFKVATSNSDNDKYGYGTGEDYYITFNRSASNTQKQVYSGSQHELKFIPDALGEYEFRVNYPSNKYVYVTFPTAYTVTFGKGTGGSSVTAKYNSTSFNSGTKVQQGKTVTFTQSASTGYTFKEWNTKSDGTGTQLSTNATYTHTVAATNTVYAIYTKKPDKTIYLEPTGHWNSDKAVFQAHVWQTGKTGVNLKMEGIGDPSHADGDNKSPYRYYKVVVPAEYDNILFFRKDNFATANENAWNKTGDLTIPTDDKVLYTITSAGKGKAEGYDPAATGVWKEANLVYTITLGYCDFGTYGFKYNGQSYFSKPNDNVTIDVPAGAQIEILEGQPFSNVYTGDVIKAKPTKEKLTIGQTLTINGDVTLDDNFVTKEPHVVYLGIPDAINTTAIWAKEGKDNFIYTWDTYASYGLVASTRSFRIDALGITYYEFTIPKERHSFRFQRKTSLDDKGTPHCESVSLEHEIPLTDVNCFTLKNEKDENNRYKGTWGTLPAQQGDHRLLYIEQKVGLENGHPKTTVTKAHPSDIIRQGDTRDTYSLHIYNKVENGENGMNDPEILLQECTGYNGVNPIWTTKECHMVFGPSHADFGMAAMPGRRDAAGDPDAVLRYDNGIENIKNDINTIDPRFVDDQASGVWNFIVTRDGSKNFEALDLTQTARYTGDYYVRTDCADGGWDMYTAGDNHMHFSAVSKAHSNYSHYFCKWVGEANVNVKYTIANDYGIAISDTLTADKTTLWGELLEDGQKMVTNETLPAEANVRFSWNEKTNGLHRAYLAGSSHTGNRFLILSGNSSDYLRDEDDNVLTDGGTTGDRAYIDANEEIFADVSNWVYFADVHMRPKAEVKITADYASKVQYFIGKPTEYCDTILQGDANDQTRYLLRLLYDFKTNELISAYVPGGQADGTIGAIETNLMLIRVENNEPKQLEFSTNNMKEAGKQAYGVLELTKATLEDNKKNVYVRSLYWISFPFDVRATDIFGFGEYGKHWIIQSYNGAKRAANGLFLDSDTNWEYHFDPQTINANPNNTYEVEPGVLKAGLGYVIALDLDQIKADNLFVGRINTLALYFPSKTTITGDIVNTTDVTITIPEHVCEINRPTPKGDRTVKDSHWNVIGVPSYINAVGDFSGKISAITENAKFYYSWLGDHDKYEVVNGNTGVEFRSLNAYMVQFAGEMKWTNVLNETPAAIAAKRNSDNQMEHELRLELQQNSTELDRTFITLQEDDITTAFDFNYDLCKIKNKGANIYSLIATDRDPIEVAGNVMPVANTTIPLGVVIAAAGEYTFAMPEGTDGIVVELIDYEANTTTNLLFNDYTVSLPKGTFENRFALSVKPDKTATSLENIFNEATGNEVKKFIIDGVLYMQKDGVLYDAQGHIVR